MKLFLCIAIIAVCTYIGRLMAQRITQRYEYLMSYQADILQLTERIIVLKMPLSSALSFAEKSDIKKLFWECARVLERSPQTSFEKLWADAVNGNTKSFLSKEDVSIIVGAGAAIENLCKNPSKEQADLYKQRLNSYLAGVEEDKQKKCKLFTTSGVLFGLLIALLII